MALNSILFVAIALFFSASSSAYIDIDSQASGEGLITGDTNSRLDWLAWK